ncbi:MAG TPA: MaoC family dehydratase N-terminal domain-containing protein [Noviherbaspirillum sp.]|uniref:FAS1-like dehydratase domain-containing protein n=1 Tax=Noviherbaspirillum sp. TaxID=1926288 RepID=UPI002B47F1B2|nr:MaoC family dehydratase N-terminal domain-containing protein [Noviherbaspirillum sp.]HJV84392.1 MaoC family dehydratase N-terminal domain-containing protein [Noviherbaspirillum sp.]
MDMPYLREWLGRTETYEDEVTRTPIASLSATLDRPDAPPHKGDILPPLWHWLYFLPVHRQSELGPDGHAARGGFLPPVPLPRRMWAGGRLQFHHPLRVGEAITRESRIVDVSYKEGRTGPLVFVLVRHEISNAEGVALTEEHDIVYRDNPKPDDPAPKPVTARGDHDWLREIRPDDVLLFRYSALTFNGHRIHYDRRYVTGVEGYPGLVVHGPLIATLLLDLLRRNLPDAVVANFSFRAIKPLFDIAPFFVCGKVEGKTVTLWAKDESGALTMDASATLA